MSRDTSGAGVNSFQPGIQELAEKSKKRRGVVGGGHGNFLLNLRVYKNAPKNR